MKHHLCAVLIICATIVIVAMLGLSLGVYGPVWKAAWVAQPADWLGFLGNVVAGFLTLSAAGVAWLAVRMQIANDRELASRGHLQAMRAIKFSLRPLLEVLAIVWTILDETLNFKGTDEEKESRTTWLKGTFYGLPPQTVVDDLKTVARGLDPEAALLFETALLRLALFYKLTIQYSEQAERSGELKWRMHDLGLMRLQLGLLKDSLEKFEPAWAKLLGEHKKLPLDNSTYANSMQESHKFWLEEEARRRSEQVNH
jgi:hypothetical protein